MRVTRTVEPRDVTEDTFVDHPIRSAAVIVVVALSIAGALGWFAHIVYTFISAPTAVQ